MHVDKQSWHYKLYKLSYCCGYRPPSKTNLCQYVRRLLSTPLVMILAIGAGCLGVFIYVFAGALIVLKSVFTLPFGYYPTRENFESPDPDDFERYPGLKVGSARLYPWHVMLPAGLVALALLAHSHGWQWITLVSMAGLVLLGIIVVIIGARRTETWRLAAAWLKAKKQGICPVVEFVDSPTTGDDQ